MIGPACPHGVGWIIDCVSGLGSIVDWCYLFEGIFGPGFAILRGNGCTVVVPSLEVLVCSGLPPLGCSLSRMLSCSPPVVAAPASWLGFVV